MLITWRGGEGVECALENKEGSVGRRRQRQRGSGGRGAGGSSATIKGGEEAAV